MVSPCSCAFRVVDQCYSSCIPDRVDIMVVLRPLFRQLLTIWASGLNVVSVRKLQSEGHINSTSMCWRGKTAEQSLLWVFVWALPQLFPGVSVSGPYCNKNQKTQNHKTQKKKALYFSHMNTGHLGLTWWQHGHERPRYLSSYCSGCINTRCLPVAARWLLRFQPSHLDSS